MVNSPLGVVSICFGCFRRYLAVDTRPVKDGKALQSGRSPLEHREVWRIDFPEWGFCDSHARRLDFPESRFCDVAECHSCGDLGGVAVLNLVSDAKFAAIGA